MHPHSRFLLRLAALVMLFAIAVPLLTKDVASQDESILRVHHAFYPDIVDPQKSSYTNEIDILALIYEWLTRLDTQQNTVPAAAESWEYNDDATRITFHLRDGLTYSDGSPLTAENFRYALERNCDPVTAGDYQAITFEIVGCAEFAGLSVDEEGNAREYTPDEHEAARTTLGVRALDDLTLPTSPFVDAPAARDNRWVDPLLVAQVGYGEWTRDGRLRHPRFLGLRHDKDARDVSR